MDRLTILLGICLQADDDLLDVMKEEGRGLRQEAMCLGVRKGGWTGRNIRSAVWEYQGVGEIIRCGKREAFRTGKGVLRNLHSSCKKLRGQYNELD
jgi:hypothetical protein